MFIYVSLYTMFIFIDYNHSKTFSWIDFDDSGIKSDWAPGEVKILHRGLTAVED